MSELEHNWVEIPDHQWKDADAVFECHVCGCYKSRHQEMGCVYWEHWDQYKLSLNVSHWRGIVPSCDEMLVIGVIDE